MWYSKVKLAYRHHFDHNNPGVPLTCGYHGLLEGHSNKLTRTPARTACRTLSHNCFCSSLPAVKWAKIFVSYISCESTAANRSAGCGKAVYTETRGVLKRSDIFVAASADISEDFYG